MGSVAYEDYEPREMALKEVRRRISEESWQSRVNDARAREQVVKDIAERIARGESQNRAIRATTEESKRSATLRDLVSYRSLGFAGLIDRRTPREPEIPQWMRDVVEIARMANPSISVAQVEQILVTKFGRGTAPSATTMKRMWNEVGLERRVGRPEAPGSAAKAEPVVEALAAAGFALLRASEAETGAVERLVDTVLAAAKDLPKPGPPDAEEVALRNARGQLTAKYNKSRRKGPDEVIGPSHRSAAEKALDRDLGRLSFKDQRRETIEQKVWALVSLPGLNTLNGRIEDLRGPQGRLLGELCGYEYQAETIRKVVSEWSVAGLGPALQQTHGETWHRVSVERWETDYRAAVAYVDNNVKPLWTAQFTKCAKVSSTGRVQPALVTTFINTGVGVPIFFETYSGTAPLPARVLQLLKRAEEQTEQPVGRLTVIDGECCSASLLLEFKVEFRDLIVPLPESMVTPERFRFGPGSAFQAYRDGDRIREGRITLTDSKNANVTVEARAIIIERRGKETWTVLVTLADATLWSCRALAEAYFRRWPAQEGFFRQANQAVGLKQVHGYGKRLVTNTAVMTQLEELAARTERTEQRQALNKKQCLELIDELAQVQQELDQVSRYRAKREERIDEAVVAERTHTRAFAEAATELREATQKEREGEQRRNKLDEQHAKLAARVEKTHEQRLKWDAEREKLESRKEILEADVSQDTIFTTMKVTLCMLLQFFVREYMPHRRIEWATFLSRIAVLPGRRETTDHTVTTFIHGNRRDVELMTALDKACQGINERRLNYKGKLLQYRVDWPEGPPEGWSS